MDDKVTDKKDERIEKAINEIYCDLDLDGQEDWDRVTAILYKAFSRQAQEAPKAASQSADDSRALARSILEVIIVAMESRPIARTGEILAAKVFVLIDDFIKADRATQRQAGREEAWKELCDKEDEK